MTCLYASHLHPSIWLLCLSSSSPLVLPPLPAVLLLFGILTVLPSATHIFCIYMCLHVCHCLLLFIQVLHVICIVSMNPLCVCAFRHVCMPYCRTTDAVVFCPHSAISCPPLTYANIILNASSNNTQHGPHWAEMLMKIAPEYPQSTNTHLTAFLL